MGDQPDQTDPSGPGSGVTPIQVDVDSLADFRALLGRELSGNLQPGSDRIQGDHSMGVRFGGRFAGGKVQAARAAYNSTLVASSGNLWQYVRTSELLIEAIEAVVAGYTSADRASAGTSNDLLTALSGVLLERADAAKPYDESETRREDHRMHS